MSRIITLGVIGRKTIPVPMSAVGGELHSVQFGTVSVLGNVLAPGYTFNANDSVLVTPNADGGTVYINISVADSPTNVEDVQDIVGAMIQAGDNATVTYDDEGNILTISSAGTSPTLRFPSITAMTGANLTHGQQVTLTEYAPGTGLGGGQFVWWYGSTLTPDGGGVVAPSDGAPGRFQRVAHLLGTFTPEDFGAVGNGAADDYDAWMRLAAAASGRNGVTIQMGPQAVYYLNRYRILRGFEKFGVTPNGINNPRLMNIDGLHIEGRGARIVMKGNFHRRGLRFNFAYDLGPTKMEWWDSPDDQLTLELVHVNNVSGGNFAVLGQADKMSSDAGKITPSGATMYVGEGYGNGLGLYHVTNLNWKNTSTTQNQTDGLYVSGIEETLGLAEYLTNEYQPSSQNLHFHNHVSRFNRRQGASLVHFRGCYFYGGDLSYTGYASVQSDGVPVMDSLGFLRPSAGVDVEPFFMPDAPKPHRSDVRVGVAHFIGTAFVNNYIGPIANAFARKVDDCLFDGCTIDMRHTQHPDAWVCVNAKGSRIVNSLIYLNQNGFLFYDYDGMQKMLSPTELEQVDVNSVIHNNDIYLQKSLGYKDTRANTLVTFDGNRIFLPDTPATSFQPPINLDDTVDSKDGKWYQTGNNSRFHFTNNRVMIPYSYYTMEYSGGGYSQQIALMAGFGKVAGNSWEPVGKKPDFWGKDSCFSVQYQSVDQTGRYTFITKPQSEHFPATGEVRVQDLFAVMKEPFTYPKPVLINDYDQPLTIYTGIGVRVPEGTHIWHGEYVNRPFDIFEPHGDNFNLFTTQPNAGEVLKIVLWAEYPGVIAEYTWRGGIYFELTGGVAKASGWPVRVEHGTPFELRTEYTNLLPADPAFPDRTWAAGAVATFRRRFIAGEIPVWF